MSVASNLLLLFILLVPIQLVSQQASKSSNNWYFGNRAGISFNTTPPSALADGKLNTQEGVATVSNFQGELLFYTDGSTIWDKTHEPMPTANGNLKGHFSSSQSAIIVPAPGQINSYFVFTVDELGGSNGLTYSQVDLNLPGNGSSGLPLGDVISNTLNTALDSPVCEKITSIQKSNNEGYWVIVHGWRNNTFYAYDVSCEGVNPNPVKTNIGQVHQGGSQNINAVGYLRATLDGDKIALASRTTNSVDIFDFDKSTGVVSNEFQISPNSSSLYGLEFSPTGDYLYIGGANNVERYSFLENSISDIQYDNSSNLENENVVRALQLGPDLKLYISHRFYDYLSVITNPDNANATIEINGIFLNTDNTGRECRFGLPNNVIVPQVNYDSLEIWSCKGVPIQFENETYEAGTSSLVNLQTNDGCDSIILLTILEHPESTSSLSFATCENQYVEFNGVEIPAGTQEPFIFQDINGCDSIVTVIVDLALSSEEDVFLETCFGQSVVYRDEFYPPGTDIIINVNSIDNCDTTIHLTVFEYPETSSSIVLEICENATVAFYNVDLQVGDQEAFVFQDINGCDSTVTVTVEPALVIEESVSLKSCLGEPVLYNNEEFLVGTDTIFEIFDDDGCKKLISLDVELAPEANFDLITSGACFNLNNGDVNIAELEGGRAPFLFSLDGQNFIENSFFLELEANDYTYYIRDGNDCNTQRDFNIIEIPEIMAEIDSREMRCEEDSILVSVFTNIPENEITWFWSNGSTGNSTYISEPGSYSVDFNNECQSFNEDISISRQTLSIESLIYIPNTFSPNLDGINDDFQVFKNEKFDISFYELQIFDRWGNNVFLGTDIDSVWNGNFKNLELQDGVYVWWLKIEGEVCREQINIIEKGNFTILK